MGRSSRQKIINAIEDLNNIINQVHLTIIYRAFHPRNTVNTFFSSTYKEVFKINYMLDHETSLNMKLRYQNLIQYVL